MNRTARKVIIGLLAMVFVGSAAMSLSHMYQYQQGEDAYVEAAELVGLPDLSSDDALVSIPDEQTPIVEVPPIIEEPQMEERPEPVYVDPYADELENMDFTALREVNADVLGWIWIPDTLISYPLMQGDDNEYYLNHTWRGTRSAVGAIFMEQSNRGDLSDFNTIIYGHRMKNRSMFATLDLYKEQNYWKKHPIIYITDDNGSHKYEIFSAYEARIDGHTYQVSFSGDESKQNYINACLEASVIETGIVPTSEDKIITLSTCTGRGHDTRWVVQALRRES